MSRWILCLAALKVALQLVTAGQYGIFRDELYYIACAEHLDFGYVDHPPLIAWITWLVIHLLGTSLYALRLLPALAAGKVDDPKARSEEWFDIYLCRGLNQPLDRLWPEIKKW